MNFIVMELKFICVYDLLWLRLSQTSIIAKVTPASTMERVLISQTALTAAAHKDLLATDVKQIRGNFMQFAMNLL